MIAIVLVGVMVDRPALTFRTLTAAALGVLLLAPEAVVNPSFQMSFAATLALIAGYQHGLPWMRAGADTPLGARIALWGGREIIGLVFASLLAGSATMIYIAYHFHQFQPYGLLANLLAMPVVSAVVMPMGILGVLAMPFGYDGICWQLMGKGIDWMIGVVLWVASLPGANTLVPSFGTGPLLLATAGLVLVCLLRTPLRLIGLVRRCWSQPSRGRCAPRNPTYWWRRTARRWLCAQPSVGSPWSRPAAISLRSANGLPPTRIRVRRRTRDWTWASPAIRPAASDAWPTDRWSPFPAASKPSRRIAAAPCWW